MVFGGCSEAKAIATLGQNRVSASVLKEDIELGCEVFAIRAGAYGEQVNKDLYREVAKEYGIHSPEVQAVIVDMDQIIESWHMEQMKQYHELLCEDQEFELQHMFFPFK